MWGSGMTEQFTLGTGRAVQVMNEALETITSIR
jgi:hypothetical protein